MPGADAARVRAILVSSPGRKVVADGRPGQIIKTVRRELQWTQAELGARAGYSQAAISRLENARTRIERDLDAITHVATALSIPMAVLGLPDQKPEDEDVKRREFLSGAVAASAMALLPRAIIDTGHIGAADIDDGWRAFRRLVELDDVRGGADGLPLSIEMAKRLQGALNRARYASNVESDLQALTAAIMEHTGWIAYDSGDTDGSRRWWLEANHLAEVAGIVEPRVTALTAMSLQTSTNPSRAKETVGLVRAARSAAGPDASPTLLSLLAAREAVAHAQQGDKLSTRTTLSESRRRLDQGRNGLEPRVLDFWGEADLACHETRVALLQGNGQAAERRARAALATADRELFPRNHTIYAVRLGQVLERTGKLDEAINVTSAAVEHVDAVKGSRRILSDLRQTVALLGTHNYRPAQEFSTAARKVLSA